MFGGLYTPSAADALQLTCLLIGLLIATPYAMLNPAVSLTKTLNGKDWLGEVETKDLAGWIDRMLLIIFGGIPWQVNIINNNFFYFNYINNIIVYYSPGLLSTYRQY